MGVVQGSLTLPYNNYAPNFAWSRMADSTQPRHEVVHFSRTVSSKGHGKFFAPRRYYVRARFHPTYHYSCKSIFSFLSSPNRASTRSNIQYTTGTTISDRNIEEFKPPMMAQARPFFQSAPAPSAKAMGSKPMTMAMFVMSTGRKRSLVANSRAFWSSTPCRLR